MNTFDIARACLGGAIIAASALLLFGMNGRIAGVSGVLGRMFSPDRNDGAWRAVFISGLVAGGLITRQLAPAAFGSGPIAGLPTLVVAGALVGFGTRVANGCTSGHGVCGLSRRSGRSLASVLVFIAAGVATVTLVRHALGGLAT